jgi:hypothetical protein
MVQDVALVNLQTKWADVGKISSFAGPMLFCEATGQAAEDKAGNKGEQVLGKHG